MRLNTKVRYGLRSMIEITMHAGTKGLLQKEIAERQDIPLKYLDRIIADLKSAGLIVNVGGKKSGYILAKNPKEITVYDIYQAAEGRMAIIQCVSDSHTCCKMDECASQEYWSYLNTEIEALMLGKNLETLAKRQAKLLASGANNLEFQI